MSLVEMSSRDPPTVFVYTVWACLHRGGLKVSRAHLHQAHKPCSIRVMPSLHHPHTYSPYIMYIVITLLQ